MPSTRLCPDASIVVQLAGKPAGPFAALAHAISDGRLSLVITKAIEDEFTSLAFRRSIQLYLYRRGISIQAFTNQIAELRQHAEFIVVSGEAPPCRDPKDRKYLHCVRDGDVPYLVTRDKDLLESTAVPAARILTPEAFVAELELS